MFRKQAIAGTVRHVALVALFIPVICLAAGGTLRFEGAITEPACAISAVHAGFKQSILQRLGTVGGPNTVDGGSMHVSMRCNANQSVGLSFESKMSSDADASGVNVVLSRVGKDLRPNDSIRLALTGTKENNIDIGTALRKISNKEASHGGRMDGAILVSVNYL